MCGKAMFLRSQSYNFDAIAHTGPYYGVESLRKISFELYRQFEKIEKVQKWLFLANFGYISQIPVIQF